MNLGNSKWIYRLQKMGSIYYMDSDVFDIVVRDPSYEACVNKFLTLAEANIEKHQELSEGEEGADQDPHIERFIQIIEQIKKDKNIPQTFQILESK